nr:uncharacterized protein LOC112008839 [Quercus suber]
MDLVVELAMGKPSQNSSNVRAQWPSRVTTIFCEACVDENKLKGSETGLGWDAAKGTIATTDKWWERKLIEVPEATKFREKGLQNIDLLDVMFKDIVATGDLAWAPTSSVLPDDLETPKEGDIPMDYNDHIGNSDEDHSYDVQNDEYDDEKL